MTRVTVAALGVWALLLSAASAQPMQQDEGGTDAPPAESVISPRTVASALAQLEREAALQTTAPQTAWAAEGRACPGCPKRSVGKALAQTTVVNGFYELANLARGQATAKITPKTWWANMKQGWVWDLDDFLVNQMGHPYQGSNYFATGRANGLSFWESAGLTAFGSGTWEYFGETNHASLNDLINTTLGGIALGEMFNRTAWLIRDPRATGRSRLLKEIAATVIDPVTGINRFISGDSSRVSGKPADMVPETLAGFAVGRRALARLELARVRGGRRSVPRNGPEYGDSAKGRSRTPYDAFAVRMRFGGGSGFSEARVRGRLLGQPLRRARSSSTSCRATTSSRTRPTISAPSPSRQRSVSPAALVAHAVRLGGWGGMIVLGAVDSLPVGGAALPVEEEKQPESERKACRKGRASTTMGRAGFGGAAALTRPPPVRGVRVRRPSSLYPRRHPRQSPAAPGASRPAGADLRTVGPRRVGRILRSPDLLPGCRQTKQSFHFPQFRAFLTWSK